MRKLLLNSQETAEDISNFLREEFEKKNKTKAVLGISGGIDSTTTAFFCKKAGLDIYTVIMPYENRGLKESIGVVKSFNLPEDHIFIIDIASIVNVQIKKLQKVIILDKIDKGNIMARQRMIIQYALARSLNGLVVGTENLSEYYLGYFTLYGDQACDISPIAGLWKTQVFQLAEYLGVSKEIIKRRPSAGLWLGQTDEDEFGFTYRDADKIMYFFIVEKYSKEKIIKKGFNLKLVNKVLGRIRNTEYKRQNSLKLLFK